MMHCCERCGAPEGFGCICHEPPKELVEASERFVDDFAGARAELSRIRGLLSDRTSLVTIVQSVKGIAMTLEPGGFYLTRQSAESVADKIREYLLPQLAEKEK